VIQKILKIVSNPQGVLVQVILDQVSKMFKMPQLLSYMEEENDADREIKKQKQELEALKQIVISIGKDQHPPAIPLKEIAEFRTMMTEFQEMKSSFKKMKKLSLLKSVFK
tara:strand:- start:66 stop:395 length:330 start_codon:yes stop_codon:yes gene_type:complete